MRYELHGRVREAARPAGPCCLAAAWLRGCRQPAFVPGRRSPPAAAPLAQGGAVPCLRRRIGRHRGPSLRPARPEREGGAALGAGEGPGQRGEGCGAGGVGGRRAAPPRPSLTWPVPPSRVHPAAQPAFLGRGAMSERRRLRAEQQRVRRLPAATVAERRARRVEAVVQQPAAQRAGGGGRCPRGGRGLRAELLPHGGGVSLPFVSRLSSSGARRSLRSRRQQLRAPGMRRPSALSPLPRGDGAGVVAAAARCRGAATALRRERGAPSSRDPGTCGPRAGGSWRLSPPRGFAPRPQARPASSGAIGAALRSVPGVTCPGAVGSDARDLERGRPRAFSLSRRSLRSAAARPLTVIYVPAEKHIFWMEYKNIKYPAATDIQIHSDYAAASRIQPHNARSVLPHARRSLLHSRPSPHGWRAIIRAGRIAPSPHTYHWHRTRALHCTPTSPREG